MSSELRSALGRLRLPMLTYQGDGLLRPYNAAATELFRRENIREDVVVSRPSHPLAALIREALAGGNSFSESRIVTFPSGQSYEVEVSYPSEKGPERWLVVLLEERRDGANRAAPALDQWGFTERERAIAELMVKGGSSDEICDALCIARSTLKTHLAAIFTKTGVRNRTALIAKLLRG